MSFPRSLVLLFASACLVVYVMSICMGLASVDTSDQAQSLTVPSSQTESQYVRTPVLDTKMNNSLVQVNKVATIKATKPLLFVHFHKSGGTSVCRLMQKPWIRVSKGDLNCNSDVSGPNHNATEVSSLQTCLNLARYVKQHNINFIAVEVPHREELPCKGFRTFSIMRDPVQRILSWINLVKGKDKLVQRFMDRKETHPPHYYFGGYPYVNSFVIRMLLGQERYRDPRPVDEYDLQRAKARVDAFDAFVPLEYLNHSNVLNLLQRKIPGYHSALVGKRKRKVFDKNEKKWFQPTPEYVQQLRKENEFDYKLYDYVLEKLGIEAMDKTLSS